MDRCTCSKDREMTCIVHPTDRSLRKRIAELEAKVARLTVDCWKYNMVPAELYLDAKAENAELKEKYEVLSKEYDKVWDVLRTYNPRDIELEYIGYKTVAVFDAETGEETTCMES